MRRSAALAIPLVAALPILAGCARSADDYSHRVVRHLDAAAALFHQPSINALRALPGVTITYDRGSTVDGIDAESRVTVAVDGAAARSGSTALTALAARIDAGYTAGSEASSAEATNVPHCVPMAALPTATGCSGSTAAGGIKMSIYLTRSGDTYQVTVTRS